MTIIFEQRKINRCYNFKVRDEFENIGFIEFKNKYLRRFYNTQ